MTIWLYMCEKFLLSHFVLTDLSEMTSIVTSNFWDSHPNTIVERYLALIYSSLLFQISFFSFFFLFATSHDVYLTCKVALILKTPYLFESKVCPRWRWRNQIPAQDDCSKCFSKSPEILQVSVHDRLSLQAVSYLFNQQCSPNIAFGKHEFAFCTC